MKKFNVLSSFILKIVALVTMTFDHVGYALIMYSINDQLGLIFRIIGRLAMPLFCFMIAEGVIHTKSFGKYILKMGIVGVMVLIAQIVMHFGFQIPLVQGNIYLDLILGAVAIKCLMDKRIYIKLLALLPLLYGVASFIFDGIEGWMGNYFWYLPYFVRTQYSFYGIALIICFYLSYKMASFGLGLLGLDKDLYKGSNMERIFVNSISAGFLIVITCLYYLLGWILSSNGLDDFVTWMLGIQNYAMISGALILLYSGLRGYNKAWFKYGSYLYYPLHLLIIGLIFYIPNLL